ncbi:MAG: phosphotransferase [Parachlamydiaceae bacterium]|nr:phosphotransferase [Parachlamydiaceae bacterium]
MLKFKWIVTVAFCLCGFLVLNGQIEQKDQIILRVAQQLADGNTDKNEIRIESLTGGLTNENYKVSIGSRCYFFRVNNGMNSLLGCSLEREWRITSIVSKFEICPNVAFYAPQEGILVTDFIQAKSDKLNLHDHATMKKLCHQIYDFHSLNIEFPTQFDPYSNIEYYLEKIRELNIKLPLSLHETILPAIRTFQQLFTSTSNLNVVKIPAHLDLHVGNILDDGYKLWLIDWEYAAMADPFFDLATLASTEKFSDSEMIEMLRYYLKRNPTKEENDYFYKMRILADTRWALWSFLQAKISPLDEPFEQAGNEFIWQILERIEVPPTFPSC